MSPPATASYLEEIIEHCKQAKFTGLLRMRSHQGEGELWFLSGVRDDARFGVSHGDEALERMGRASEPTFELVPRLPPATSSSKRGYPLEGVLGDLRPVDLFRFCETNALTCTLELSRGKTSARARYQLGELMGVESDSADAAGIAQMLEWTEGNYRFELPPLELPSGVPVHVPAAPVAEVLASLGLDSQPAPQDTARNKADEEAAARKKADEEAAARKKADEEAAARKKAEEEAAARKKADEEAAARRKAEEEAAARKKAEAEAARKQAEEEEAQRRAAEEEAKRKAVSVHRQIAIGSSTSPGPSEPPRPDPTPPSPAAAEPAATAEAAPPSSKASQASAPEIAVSEAPAEEPQAAEPVEEKPAKSERKPAKSAEKKPKSVRKEAPAAVVESEPPPAPKKGGPWLAIFVVLLLAAAAAYYFYTAR